jgi:ribosomal protein L37E
VPNLSFYEEELRKFLGGVRSSEDVESKGTEPAKPYIEQHDVSLEPDGPPDTTPVEDDPDPSTEDQDVEEEAQPVGSEPSDTPVRRRNVFTHHDSHPLLLDMILLKKYGPIWLTWEAETVWDEIADDFKQTVSAGNVGKIQAVKTCHLVETPWKAWEGFNPVCQALNNNIPDFRSLQKPTPAQVILAVTLMNIIKREEFSNEVSMYIAACFLDEGIFYLPPPVTFAQKPAMRLQYRCKKCGRVDVDEDNVMCDSCGAPQSQLVKEPTWDPTPVEKRYNEIIRQGDDHDVLQETTIDVQVAHLLVARNYVEFRNRQLREQAKAVDRG